MKNLIKLYNPSDIQHFVTNLWKTSIFQKSPYILQWATRFAARNGWVFAEMSEPELEYAHFGTWFGMTYMREYDNPVVSDLYYLHEIVHAVLAKYDPNDSFTSWYRRVNTIEFDASLETEAYIYLNMPEFRKVSFDDRIWADRFIGSILDRGELMNLMRQERYRAIREPDPMDYCEQQISAYARQNFEWANIWKLNALVYDAGKVVNAPAFKHVERHMAAFRNNEIDVDDHVYWLTSMTIPFPDQAKMFSDVYWKNKLGYRKS
jgi:hypothetical protein